MCCSNRHIAHKVCWCRGLALAVLVFATCIVQLSYSIAHRAGCACSSKLHVEALDHVQVLDTKVSDGKDQCAIKVAAGAEVLVTAVYAIKGTIESKKTTIYY
jgi:hypothetical protein